MNNEELGFVFHPDRCIQCLGCEGACKQWRSVAPGLRYRRVLNIWHGDYPNVTCAPACLSCQHCAAPACVDVCPSGAITKRSSDGAVLVDTEKCTGCRACLEACPFDVPQFAVDGLMRKCDRCASGNLAGSDETLPACVRTCPTGALELISMISQEKTKQEEALLKTYRLYLSQHG